MGMGKIAPVLDVVAELPSDLTIPAVRSIAGPIAEPRTLAPASTGAPYLIFRRLFDVPLLGLFATSFFVKILLHEPGPPPPSVDFPTGDREPRRLPASSRMDAPHDARAPHDQRCHH